MLTLSVERHWIPFSVCPASSIPISVSCPSAGTAIFLTLFRGNLIPYLTEDRCEISSRERTFRNNTDLGTQIRGYQKTRPCRLLSLPRRARNAVHRGSWPRRAMSSSLERAFLPARGTSPTFFAPPTRVDLPFPRNGPPGSWLERGSDLCLVTFFPINSPFQSSFADFIVGTVVTKRWFSLVGVGGGSNVRALRTFGVWSYVIRGGEKPESLGASNRKPSCSDKVKVSSGRLYGKKSPIETDSISETDQTRPNVSSLRVKKRSKCENLAIHSKLSTTFNLLRCTSRILCHKIITLAL